MALKFPPPTAPSANRDPDMSWSAAIIDVSNAKKIADLGRQSQWRDSPSLSADAPQLWVQKLTAASNETFAALAHHLVLHLHMLESVPSHTALKKVFIQRPPSNELLRDLWDQLSHLPPSKGQTPLLSHLASVLVTNGFTPKHSDVRTLHTLFSELQSAPNPNDDDTRWHFWSLMLQSAASDLETSSPDIFDESWAHLACDIIRFSPAVALRHMALIYPWKRLQDATEHALVLASALEELILPFHRARAEMDTHTVLSVLSQHAPDMLSDCLEAIAKQSIGTNVIIPLAQVFSHPDSDDWTPHVSDDTIMLMHSVCASACISPTPALAVRASRINLTAEVSIMDAPSASSKKM